eukprot:NODE_4793_length_1846_cov_18.200116.p1 GENE.NODE_4793_length_1846_cov_18.200116~~NODE_4793_length_1846_cov_18.200116.p1  ORF type:complete len:494 (-),score=106.84 NODE_4793_length_1846_cov_18.200116:364-1707(-)
MCARPRNQGRWLRQIDRPALPFTMLNEAIGSHCGHESDTTLLSTAEEMAPSSDAIPESNATTRATPVVSLTSSPQDRELNEIYAECMYLAEQHIEVRKFASADGGMLDISLRYALGNDPVPASLPRIEDVYSFPPKTMRCMVMGGRTPLLMRPQETYTVHCEQLHEIDHPVTVLVVTSLGSYHAILYSKQETKAAMSETPLRAVESRMASEIQGLKRDEALREEALRNKLEARENAFVKSELNHEEAFRNKLDARENAFESEINASATDAVALNEKVAMLMSEEHRDAKAAMSETAVESRMASEIQGLKRDEALREEALRNKLDAREKVFVKSVLHHEEALRDELDAKEKAFESELNAGATDAAALNEKVAMLVSTEHRDAAAIAVMGKKMDERGCRVCITCGGDYPVYAGLWKLGASAAASTLDHQCSGKMEVVGDPLLCLCCVTP